VPAVHDLFIALSLEIDRKRIDRRYHERIDPRILRGAVLAVERGREAERYRLAVRGNDRAGQFLCIPDDLVGSRRTLGHRISGFSRPPR